MRKEELFRAIGDVRDELILEAEPVQRKPAVWKKVLPMAAAALLLIGGTLFMMQNGLLNMRSPEKDAAAPAEAFELAGEVPHAEEAFAEEAAAAPLEETVPEIAEEAPAPAPAEADGFGMDKEEAEYEIEEELAADEYDIEADNPTFFQAAGGEDEGKSAEAETTTTAVASAEAAFFGLAYRFEEGAYLTVSEAAQRLRTGETVAPEDADLFTMLSSLDYTAYLPEKEDGTQCGLRLSDDGSGLLFVRIVPEQDGYLELSMKQEAYEVTEIARYGDMEALIPGERELLFAGDVSAGSQIVLLYQLTLSGPVSPDEEAVTLELSTEGGAVSGHRSIGLTAEPLSEAPDLMKLAVCCADTAAFLQEGRTDDASFAMVRETLSTIPDSRGTEELDELLELLADE